MRRVRLFLFPLTMFASAALAIGQVPRLPVPPISGPPKAMPQGAPTPAPTPGPYVDDWSAFMTRYNEVIKVPKTDAYRVSAKLVRPSRVVAFNMEFVSEDADSFYVRNLPIESPDSPSHNAWLSHEAAEVGLAFIQENEKKYFILAPFEPLVPPPFTDRVRFEERSEGLPTDGKWQMGFAHGDFNHDGREDLVFPPARMGKPYPTVFLQTEEGWKASEETRWPQTKFDYGDVGVADFDGDGNLDIAIACHFLRNYVLYGNGKGDFTRVVELPSVNPNMTSRAIAVADFDGDGRPDVALFSELDLELGTNQAITSGLLTVCLNTKSGWRAVDASGGRTNLFGDQVAVGDFDADGHPDILISSHKNINRYLIYRNQGDGRSWTPVALNGFPFRAFVWGVAGVNVDGLPGDEAVMAFYQNVESGSLSFPRDAIAVYSFIVGPDGLEMKERKMVAIDAATHAVYTCASAGDFDGDGLIDLVFGRQNGPVEVYLQDPAGTFLQERSPEINLGEVWVNSVQVVKLTPKGPTALIIASSDGPNKTNGSIRCFVVHKGALDSARRPQ